MNLTNISSGPINVSSITEPDFEIAIGQAWIPSISLPTLMLISIGVFGFLLAIVSSVQVVRERRKDLGRTMNFNERDEEARYKPTTSSASQSEYLKIDPLHPHIDPVRLKQPAARYATLELLRVPDGASFTSSPPSAGPMTKRVNHSGTRKNTNTNQASAQLSPSQLPQHRNQVHSTQPATQQQVQGSPSKSRHHSDPDRHVDARESSSAPMVMSGLWKRIERVLKMGFDADTSTCQLSFVHHNNNSALRPSCSDSASLPIKRPMVFRTDCTASLIGSSCVQLQSTSSQTETSSSTFPRKISCRCCRERQSGLHGKDALQRSSSSSLLKNIYLKNSLRALNWGEKYSDLTSSETSNPRRPKLAIKNEDITKKLCLSVDERIRRYRLCYSSSSDDDSDV